MKLVKILSLFVVLSMSTASCSPVGRAIAHSAIDVLLATCISEHADIEDEAALKEICKWTPEVEPEVRKLIAARKAGIAKAAKAGACKAEGDDE